MSFTKITLTLAAAFAITILIAGCAAAPKFPQTTVMGMAPKAYGDNNLGRPVDKNFTVMAEQGSLFPDAKIRKHKESDVAAKTVVFRREESLKANISVWRIFSAGIETSASSRYGVYRVSYITQAAELDDSAEMDDPPKGAKYYVSKIYYGHLYEAVVFGSESDFHGGVEAKLGKYNGNLGDFKKEHNLKVEVLARGVEHKSEDALYISNQEDFQRYYKPDYDNPVPIFIEYKSLPDRKAPDSKTIKFAPGPAFEDGNYYISADEASIEPFKESGKGWDAALLGSSKPDPQVDVYKCGSGELIFSTKTSKDTLNPRWGENGQANLSGKERLCIKAWDIDGLSLNWHRSQFGYWEY